MPEFRERLSVDSSAEQGKGSPQSGDLSAASDGDGHRLVTDSIPKVSWLHHELKVGDTQTFRRVFEVEELGGAKKLAFARDMRVCRRGVDSV